MATIFLCSCDGSLLRYFISFCPSTHLIVKTRDVESSSTGSGRITGSLDLTGSLEVDGNVSASGNLIGVTGSLNHIVVNNKSLKVLIS